MDVETPRGRRVFYVDICRDLSFWQALLQRVKDSTSIQAHASADLSLGSDFTKEIAALALDCAIKKIHRPEAPKAKKFPTVTHIEPACFAEEAATSISRASAVRACCCLGNGLRHHSHIASSCLGCTPGEEGNKEAREARRRKDDERNEKGHRYRSG